MNATVARTTARRRTQIAGTGPRSLTAPCPLPRAEVLRVVSSAWALLAFSGLVGLRAAAVRPDAIPGSANARCRSG
jgi:hypothetical protein